MSVAQLTSGQFVTVVGLSDECQGLNRRRLMDLGLTPGARIRLERMNMGRSAYAVRVRNSLIALRREQAEMIEVRPAA